MASAAAPSSTETSVPAHGGWQGVTVRCADLQRAWALLHRSGAPELTWEHRLLLLTGLFTDRPSAWVVALEARLRALEAQTALIGKAPTDEAFKQAAEARLQALGSDFRFVPGTCSW